MQVACALSKAGEVPGDASLPAGASAPSVVQLQCPSSVTLLHSPQGQSCRQPRLQMPCESSGPSLPSVPHRKVTLNGFVECVYCVYLLFFLVRCWILIRRLWIHALPLEKVLFVSVHLLTCIIFVCECLISADCKLNIKTEVVFWKYLHNTQLEETPSAVGVTAQAARTGHCRALHAALPSG